MYRPARVPRALCVLLAVPAAAWGKEGSPPGKGPAPGKLPHYQVARDFRLPASPTWTRAKKRGHVVVGAREDQPYLAEKDNLLTYQVDAVTTDGAILIGYATKAPRELKVAGRPFSEEPYGIGVPHGDDALRLALDDALAARERNGDWKKAYDATIGLSGVPPPRPPAIDRYPAN